MKENQDNNQSQDSQGAIGSQATENNVVEHAFETDQKSVSRGFYALPNVITTAGLFAGFYAIMQARLGHYEAACIAIYVAMIMDVLDGRLARLTNTQTEFGSETPIVCCQLIEAVKNTEVTTEYAINELRASRLPVDYLLPLNLF